MAITVECLLNDASSRNYVARVSCKTCKFLQEKIFNFFLHFVGSCKNLAGICTKYCCKIPSSSYKIQENLCTFFCKNAHVLQDSLVRLFLLGCSIFPVCKALRDKRWLMFSACLILLPFSFHTYVASISAKHHNVASNISQATLA